MTAVVSPAMAAARRRILAAALCFTLLPGAAPAPAQPASAAGKLKVLASFSILGDLVRNVGGDRLDLATLVGPNSDAHVYAAAPADAKKVAEARLVILNGLGFEGWMERLVKASGGQATMVIASKGVRQRRSAGGHAGHDGGQVDPHAWQSVPNAEIYVANIRDALIAVDPSGRDAYAGNAAAYLARLDALDRELVAAVAAIPADRRRIISSHDAFGYFQERYGIEFVAPQGVSTESEASARDVARIITQIRKEKIPAVFMENITDPRLMQRIAHETGARIGGKLYSDALTDGRGEAPTYIDLMRHNMRTLSAALGS
ncbi:MAG TPA: metal ABC transporter substrate-binding protein [Xanthobacteraceae bacterium]